MSKKYVGLAEEIVSKIGGPDNVSAVWHCQTRLRFTLKDTGKADKEAIQGMDGVAQVVESGGMFQVVIGMHIAEVYEEVEKLIPAKDGEQVQGQGGGEKMSPVNFAIELCIQCVSADYPGAVRGRDVKGADGAAECVRAGES